MITYFRVVDIRMMFRFLALPAVAITLLGGPACQAVDSSAMDAAPRQVIDDFSLPTAGDRTVSLSRDPSVRLHVLCFLGTECPLARVYGPRLQRMSAEFEDRGVEFIGINSNVQDSMDDLKRYVEEHGIEFPVAKDHDRQVALNAGATRTPEVFVIDRTGSIRYQGRIDDQYQPGAARPDPKRHDLRDAINELLSGTKVSFPRTTAVGCLIALPRQAKLETDITFCDQVIRVLHKHCIECHREGEIGPFNLTDYDEVVGWADMSLEVIDQGRMPPWHADSSFGDFANSRHMPEQDKELLRQWVEAGMPYGNASQLPPEPEYVKGWRLPREPDVVLPMSGTAFQVPAEGTVEYQYFVVDPKFKEDKWIRAAEMLPGNSAVVHHAIAFTRPPDGSDFRDIGFLSAYVPGQLRGDLPDGHAQLVAAGSRIVFQMHYTPSGKPEQDITRLGLVFAEPDEVTHEVFVLGGIQQDFEIPPGAAHHHVNGQIGWFPKDGSLLAITPHMHLRGKAFQFRITSDGSERKLLDIPSYDFNWQHNYELKKPLKLEQIDQLAFTAVFDNSTTNPNNPDPTEFVTWGDQTWQEMAVTFITVARPRNGGQVKSSPDERRTRRRQLLRQRQEWEREAEAFADAYIARFDSNDDQHLTSRELPDSVRLFSFREFDNNRDDRLSRDEIKAERYRRLQRDR